MLNPAPHQTLLVVAPDHDLRRSLAFLLAAEGFGAEQSAVWPPEDRLGFDGVIMDDAALPRRFRDDGRLRSLGPRLVLLSGGRGTPAFAPDATMVRKPLLDRILIDSLASVFVRPARHSHGE